MKKVFIEARGFQYGSNNAQLHDISYIVESPEEFYGQNVQQYQNWGYGCCYNCSSEYLAGMLGISEETLQNIAQALGNGKTIACRTIGRYADGFVATEENTPLELTEAAKSVCK